MRHMTAYLVRSARFQHKPAQAVAAVPLNRKEICRGILTVGAHTALDYRLFLTCDRRAYPSAAEVEVFAYADIDLITALLQSVRAEPALCNDHAAAGVAVEAVDASENSPRAMCGKIVCKRITAMLYRLVAGHHRRLVKYG
jgi:hypothetical protein